jgi:hypothetical protein
MFGFGAKTENRFRRVEDAARRGTRDSIRRTAFAIGRFAKGLIEKSRKPSSKGSPPTTRGRGGKNLRAAIWTDADAESAFIGPRASVVGDVGEAHEFGVKRKGDEFDERPFMGPALEANQDRFASDWRGSIGE